MAWMLFWSFLCLGLFNCTASKQDACYSSCGPLTNLSYPFRFKGDPEKCGHSAYELTCESSRPVLYLNLTHQRYYVLNISYERQTIRLVDPGLRRDNCSSLPRYSSFFLPYTDEYFGELYVWPSKYRSINVNAYRKGLLFVNCSQPVGDDLYVSTAPCIQSSSAGSYLYAIMGHRASVSDVHSFCRVVMNVPVLDERPYLPYRSNYSEMHSLLMMGFELSWDRFMCKNMNCWSEPYSWDCTGNSLLRMRRNCSSCKKLSQSVFCFFEIVGNYLEVIIFCIYYYVILELPAVALLYMCGRTAIGILCLLIFVLYRLRRKHIWMDTTVEEFLSAYRWQMPRRYSYSRIKKMTRNFKEKLGQGGYGFVFKGKLSNGHLVAVKMLKVSKANGQEFINEVSTIGRIHHANVVRLIGFCSEESKRALIYEFMPNGSLDKYIFSQEKSNALCWNKMYDIALGVARGIEYLHQGCDMQILHFDIKPHNILLDKNFKPKVSDFGLAKFYPTEESTVSVTAVKGTIGYIAPELFYKRIGGVSYKSDIYSFGMLLMEIAGRRKNINAYVEHSSQVYFPSWIYDQLDQKGDKILEDYVDDKEIVKKLIIVALWCIQMKPADRPSMTKVIEMLEGSAEGLQMPPKPLLSFPQEMIDQDHATHK